MRLERNESGVWRYIDGPPPAWNHDYAEAIPRYLTALDTAFTKARETCEFEFLLVLFRVKGLQEAGWDPYETSLRAIEGIAELNDIIRNYETQQHIYLWLYGHIVEASVPYEMLANLIGISQGERYQVNPFPLSQEGRYPRPNRKLQKIKMMAKDAKMPGVVTPLEEVWNRDLRNAIFRSSPYLSAKW